MRLLKPGHIKQTLLFSIIALIACNPVVAENLSQCISPAATGITYQAPPQFSPDEQENIDISANKTLSEKDGSSRFKGDVVIQRHQLRIRSDYARFDNTHRTVSVDGNVHMDTTSMAIEAEHGEFFIDEKNSEFIDIRFLIPETGIRGKAEQITSTDDKFATLTRSSITSCPPDDIDWLLRAKSVELDLADEYGKARGVVLEFQNVPFLYTPYMEFPIGDKRRSGLLAPSIGSSSSRGFELVVPWYWNIAPNMDAIIAPHYMNRRGLQLDGQYRYLTRTTNGQFDINYLYEDKVTDEERYSVKYLQNTEITRNVRFKIDYRDVSDTDYLQDFSTSLLGTSTTHLSKSADLVASYTNWHMSALVQTYETLDTTILTADRPYRKLPQLQLKGDEELLEDFNFTLHSEWVNFIKDDNVSDEGPRFTIKPGVELNWQGSAWFLKPAIEFSHTQYNISDGSGASIDTRDLNLPISSIDSGLFFERQTSNNFIQTLEPRLFYLNIPFEDQSTLPLFDTSDPDFTLSQMFRKNRFNGGDRIGDANQLTAALRSRIINPATGKEYMRASIGQIYYFEDRRVTLSGIPETTSSSDIIAEISGSLGNWSAQAGTQWDTDVDRSTKSNASIHYQNGNDRIFNLGYSKRRQTPENTEALEQTDFSFVAPISNKFTVLGRWNYSLEQSRDLETIAGLSYDSCCWSMIVALQRHLVNSSSISEEYDNAILFQLVLKGLGSVSGDSAVNTLKQSILGFNEDF